MSAAVIIPLRGFSDAKGRLAEALDSARRENLARTLLRSVMTGAAPLPVLVVSNDPAVRQMAERVGASVVDDPGTGLDAAVAAGVIAARDRGHARAVVAHGDLPFAAGLADLGRVDGIVLVPDRRMDGSNVISIPTDVEFRFHYGPNSFDRHRSESRRLGVEPTVVSDSRLSWDVDLPEDLITPPEWGPPPWELDDD